jgi:hypothetical protein
MKRSSPDLVEPVETTKARAKFIEEGADVNLSNENNRSIDINVDAGVFHRPSEVVTTPMNTSLSSPGNNVANNGGTAVNASNNNSSYNVNTNVGSSNNPMYAYSTNAPMSNLLSREQYTHVEEDDDDDEDEDEKDQYDDRSRSSSQPSAKKKKKTKVSSAGGSKVKKQGGGGSTGGSTKRKKSLENNIISSQPEPGGSNEMLQEDKNTSVARKRSLMSQISAITDSSSYPSALPSDRLDHGYTMGRGVVDQWERTNTKKIERFRYQ